MHLLVFLVLHIFSDVLDNILSLFSVYSFEMFVPSDIPFLIFFSFVFFFFLFYFIVFLSPLCCNSWPSSQYCFLLLLSFIRFFHSVAIMHHSTFLSLDFCPLPLYSFSPRPLRPCFFIFCAFIETSHSFILSISVIPPTVHPSGGCQAAAPTQTSNTEIKKKT
jgi:hypothetical protein